MIWIHRMAAILSEITSKINISAWKDRLTEVYATVNDKVLKVKEALSEEKKPEAKKPEAKKPEETSTEKKEEPYAAAPKTTNDKIADFFAKLKFYFIIGGTILLKVIFYFYLASLVANDMIMYAPVMRAFFFIFTLIVTYNFAPYAFFLTCYYLLRRGYDYYHQNLSSEMPKPPLSFPMIFAILPLTTYYPESPIGRFFLWAFMYQKSDKPKRMERENDRLEIIMTEYWKDLNKSFDYLENIKANEPFSGLYELNRQNLTRDHMHPIKKPDTVVEPSEELPDVVVAKKEGQKNEEKNAPKNEGVKNEPKNEPKKVTFFKPQSIAQAEAEKKKEEEDKQAAIVASQPKPAPLPPTIGSPSTGSLPPTIGSQSTGPVPATIGSPSTGSLPPTIAIKPNGQVPATVASPTTGSLPPTIGSPSTGSLPPTIASPTSGSLPPSIAKQPNVPVPETVAVKPTGPLPPTIALNPASPVPETVAVKPTGPLPPTIALKPASPVPATVAVKP